MLLVALAPVFVGEVGANAPYAFADCLVVLVLREVHFGDATCRSWCESEPGVDGGRRTHAQTCAAPPVAWWMGFGAANCAWAPLPPPTPHTVGPFVRSVNAALAVSQTGGLAARVGGDDLCHDRDGGFLWGAAADVEANWGHDAV